MANKAQTALQGLLVMQEDGKAASANSKKLLDARNDFDVTAGGEAEFALPEAMATAVGAGWLLGPVGGLLMGVAQGVLGKKEKQAALDNYAQDMGVLQDTTACSMTNWTGWRYRLPIRTTWNSCQQCRRRRMRLCK